LSTGRVIDCLFFLVEHGSTPLAKKMFHPPTVRFDFDERHLSAHESLLAFRLASFAGK
jgi:hypothetical protein